jgi:hypothetical protein
MANQEYKIEDDDYEVMPLVNNFLSTVDGNLLGFKTYGQPSFEIRADVYYKVPSQGNEVQGRTLVFSKHLERVVTDFPIKETPHNQMGIHQRLKDLGK